MLCCRLDRIVRGAAPRSEGRPAPGSAGAVLYQDGRPARRSACAGPCARVVSSAWFPCVCAVQPLARVCAEWVDPRGKRQGSSTTPRHDHHDLRTIDAPSRYAAPARTDTASADCQELVSVAEGSAELLALLHVMDGFLARRSFFLLPPPLPPFFLYRPFRCVCGRMCRLEPMAPGF